MIRAVTVYCSSSGKVSRVYHDAANALGRAIAEAGWTLVYGGNRVGCMQSLADGARRAGGKVVGITPRLLLEKGIADEQCDPLIVTDDMRQRKALMEQRGDAFVALPGGLGTLEEIFEIMVGRALGSHDKPIVLLNVGGFYDPLLAMLDHGVSQHFISPRVCQSWHVYTNVASAIRYLRDSRPSATRPLHGADGVSD